MKTTVITPAELTVELLECWKALCRASDIYRSPFYWPQFTLAVGNVRNDTRIAVYEQRGEVVGFLPFHLGRGGSGKPVGGQLNDYQGPVLAPGVALSSGQLLGGAGITSYNYNHMPVIFSSLTADAHSTAVSPQIDLSGGYDDFVAQKGSRWARARKVMRRRYRKTEKEIGPLRFTYHDATDAVYSDHTRMKNELLSRVGTRLRITGWIGEVLERLRDVQQPDFAGVMTTLHAGDRLIASHFGIRSNETWHYWFSAYDLDTHALGPGINLVNHCAMAAKEHGIRTIDFGRGDADYKTLFANTHVDLCEGSITHPASLSRVVKKTVHPLLVSAEGLPLGRFKSYPRRIASRLVSNVALSVAAQSELRGQQP